MITPWTIFEYLMSCFDFVFLLLIPALQLGLRDRIRKWHVAVYILIVSLLVTLYNYSTFNSISVIYISIAIVIMSVFIFNKGELIAKVFWMFFPISIVFYFELFVVYMMIDVFSMPADAIADHNKYRLIFIIFTKLCYILMFWFLAFRYRLIINNKSKVYIIPIFISVLLLPAFELLNKNVWPLGIIFLANCFFYANAIRVNQKHQDEMQLQQMKLKMKNSMESIALREHLDKFQGEVNASLQIIWGLAKLHEIPEIERYLKQFSNINMRFSELYDTGNHFLDIVLSKKDAFARKRNIRLQTNIDEPLEESLNYIDIGNMLIHLIDNAIEAVDRILRNDEDDRTVKMEMRKEKGQYIITLENPTDGAPVPSLKVLLSKEEEGLGLKAVKELVDRYQGSLEIVNKGNKFKTTIKLPL